MKLDLTTHTIPSYAIYLVSLLTSVGLVPNDTTALRIAGLIVVAVTFACSVWAHAKAHTVQGLLAEALSELPVKPADPAATPPVAVAVAGGVVKSLFLLCGLGMLAGLSGCADSPIQKAYAARTLFNGAASEANVLYQHQQIPRPVFVEIVAAEDAAVPVLDEADRAAIAGDRFRFSAVYAKLQPQLDALLVKLAASRPKSPAK